MKQPPVHLVLTIDRSPRRGVIAVTGCGERVPFPNQAELYGGCTAWGCLTECPECRARIGLAPLEEAS